MAIFRSIFGPEDAERTEQSEEMGLEVSATQRIVKARGYGGLAPGEVLARAIGVALALGCLSPRRWVMKRNRKIFRLRVIHHGSFTFSSFMVLHKTQKIRLGKEKENALLVQSFIPNGYN